MIKKNTEREEHIILASYFSLGRTSCDSITINKVGGASPRSELTYLHLISSKSYLQSLCSGQKLTLTKMMTRVRATKFPF